jgi:hypothetical protein
MPLLRWPQVIHAHWHYLSSNSTGSHRDRERGKRGREIETEIEKERERQIEIERTRKRTEERKPEKETKREIERGAERERARKRENKKREREKERNREIEEVGDRRRGRGCKREKGRGRDLDSEQDGLDETFVPAQCLCASILWHRLCLPRQDTRSAHVPWPMGHSGPVHRSIACLSLASFNRLQHAFPFSINHSILANKRIQLFQHNLRSAHCLLFSSPPGFFASCILHLGCWRHRLLAASCPACGRTPLLNEQVWVCSPLKWLCIEA